MRTRSRKKTTEDLTSVNSGTVFQKVVNKKRVKIWNQTTLSLRSFVPVKTELQNTSPSVTQDDSPQEIKIEEIIIQDLYKQDILKQEEDILKPEFDKQDNSTDTETIVPIKEEITLQSMQEELKRSGPPFVSDLMPDPEDSNFYCRVCKTNKKDKRSFRGHCIKNHGMKLPPTPKLLQKCLLAKFPNIMPDVDDPDYNCCVCQKNYSDKYNYRRHLRTCHKMVLKPLTQCIVKHPHIIPDENDPNYYCAACERTFNDKWGYHSHLEAVHNLALKGGQRTNKTDGPLPDEDDPNGHCSRCNKTLETLRSYRNHLRKIHGMILKPRGRALRAINVDLKPDEDDPNNYCLVCDRHYGVKRGYRVHLETMHNMVLQSCKRQKAEVITKDSTVIPDPNDPNFFCCLCIRTYNSLSQYRYHLSKAHKMVLDPLRPQKRVDTSIPDIDNPDFFCLSCNRKYGSRALYRKHVGRVHKNCRVTISKSVKVFRCFTCDRQFSRKMHEERHLCRGKNPKSLPETSNVLEDVENIKPDEDDPYFYCSACRKHSPDKRTFNNHLNNVHSFNIGNEFHSPPPITEPLPDIHHPEFYCSLCKRNLSTLDNFHRHLRSNHKMKFTIPRKTHDVILHPELKPDEFDPDLKCIACEKTFSCSSGFRNHLRKIHKMTLSGGKRRGPRIRHPKIIPDQNDPDNCCHACERTYSSRLHYRDHLRGVHKMSLRQ